MKNIFLLTVLIFCMQSVFSQSLLPTPLNIKTAIDKGTRSNDGKPGKNYWQNSADYSIAVNFELWEHR